MLGEIEGNQRSLIGIGPHEQPPVVPRAPLFAEFDLESNRRQTSHRIPGLEIEQETPPMFFPELKLRTSTDQLTAALAGLSADDPVSRTQLLRCFRGISRNELADLKKPHPENPLSGVFTRMDGRTKSLLESLDESSITLAQQTLTVFKEGSDGIPKEHQTLLVDAVLAALMGESQPEEIQLVAQLAYDRIHTELEPQEAAMEGGHAILRLVQRVPVKAAVPLTLLGAWILTGCSGPHGVNIAVLSTPPGETPATIAPLPTPTKERATPTPPSATPTEAAPTPTTKPTKTPLPTPTTTEIPPTPTEEKQNVVLCSDPSQEQIQKWLDAYQNKHPKASPENWWPNSIIRLSDNPATPEVEPDVCLLSWSKHSTVEKTLRTMGFPWSAIESCKEKAYKIFAGQWNDASIWALEPNTERGFGFSNGPRDKGPFTCSWKPYTITSLRRTEIINLFPSLHLK